MASAAKKWLIGCSGAGCLVIVLVIALMIGGSVAVGRKMVVGFEEATTARSTLDERFGTVEAYEPAPDGSITADRMQVFLKVREATQASRDFATETFAFLEDPEARFENIEDEGAIKKFKEVFSVIGQALDVAPAIGGLFQARNQALLDNGMGLGEYSYIFVVSYVGTLGMDPRGSVSSESFEATNEGTQINLGGDMSNSILPRLRREWIARLEVQIAALEGQPELQAQYQSELTRMQQNLKAWPWEDGVPDSVRVSVEPFEAELRSWFAPQLGALEIGLNKKQGSSSYTME